MDNSIDLLSLISELGKDPAALSVISELMKSFGNSHSPQAPESVQTANFSQFTAPSHPIPPQNCSGNGNGFSPELLSSLLSSLGGNGRQDERKPESDCGSHGSLNKLLGGKTESENRTRLLNALRPYLCEERRAKIDLILKLLKVAELGKLSGILNSV